MFYPEGEIVKFCRPIQEPGFTTAEIQELWSLLEDPARSNSGSQDSSQAVSLIDEERRRKRMISNRESARRSRLRKKRHLENLAVQTDRLKMKNQELKRQLNLVVNRYYMVRRQNEGLWSEFVALHARLSDLYRISVPMQEKENSCMQISFNYFS
ncbi:bZIP transcription factor 53-like [Cucumis melo var. makuwa]|uniref:BZIP transcription factor 53-like n=2 Tax=Cucumis melo TaxID=3656 RepID=A0A1S4DZ83_CUCME|nr:basic leucine zipper 4-like [Cucumis melo]KAA0064465.1 bZIP transcription factor 53-like [Cucumis melo var. makuwa]TYK20123.1 bZIP transcription factor 53-like [Cucumis melo var. makuwa]